MQRTPGAAAPPKKGAAGGEEVREYPATSLLLAGSDLLPWPPALRAWALEPGRLVCGPSCRSRSTRSRPMEPITIFRDPASLEGTAYIELLPGGYRDSSWNAGSVFLTEEVFGYFEPIIERHESRFDHFAFVDVERPTWNAILKDLAQVASALRTAASIDEVPPLVGFFYLRTKQEFAASFRENADTLAALLDELGVWLQEQLSREPVIAVLGM